MFGSTSATMVFLTTKIMTKDISLLDVSLAHDLPGRWKVFAREDGGGRPKTKKSVDFILKMIKFPEKHKHQAGQYRKEKEF